MNEARRMPSSGMLHRVALVAYFLFHCSVHRLLVTASVVPSSPILDTVMMEALSSSETSVLTRATRRDMPEYGILHGHRREDPHTMQEINMKQSVSLLANYF
jgi:hypothetical protein